MSKKKTVNEKIKKAAIPRILIPPNRVEKDKKKEASKKACRKRYINED